MSYFPQYRDLHSAVSKSYRRFLEAANTLMKEIAKDPEEFSLEQNKKILDVCEKALHVEIERERERERVAKDPEEFSLEQNKKILDVCEQVLHVDDMIV